MPKHENYEAPFDTDAELTDPEIDAATQAWLEGELGADDVGTDAANEANEDSFTTELSTPFVGKWHELVSRTNWEKGRIISEWREALIALDVPSTQYSDETWARQVGGVTAPHVGRLRRVFEKFGDAFPSYSRLSWTHFLVAMDWDDAPLWLQGASDGGWSVTGMRRQRLETVGGVDESHMDVAAMTSDVDEDYVSLDSPRSDEGPNFPQPAQGGGSSKKYDDEPSNISAGPAIEGPDFGDEESLNALPTSLVSTPSDLGDDAPAPGVLVQPFAGLPELPDDLADAVELLKLAVVRHKATGWQSVDVDTVRSYLSAFLILIDARSR